jgi:hypothetical protein
MNAYQYIVDTIAAGTEHLVAAMLSIFFYFISTGTLTANDMTASNLAIVMASLGYSYNTSTDIFNDGESDYTINQLLSSVITDYYATTAYLDAGTMNGLIDICYAKGKIVVEERTALLALIQSVRA